MFDEEVKPEKLVKFIGSVRAVFPSKEAAEKWTEEHEYPCCFFVNVAEDEVTYTSFLVSGLDMCFVMKAVEKLLSELPCKGEFKECEAFGSFTLMGDNGFIVKFEPMNAWKENHHGKSIQHSVLGRVKAKLKQSPKVYVCSKWEATTKTCSNCGYKQEMSEKIRVYECPKCGMILDRDVNAAINILKAVPMERREVRACAMQEAASL